MDEQIAIFDIGKTNKKFLLFNRDYQLVHQEDREMDQISDEDEDPCEDVDQLSNWMVQILEGHLNRKDLAIKAVNVSTYGASLVHVDDKGKPVAPLYNYLKPFPEWVLEKFHATYGNKEQMAVETSSPPLGMLNSGLQLYMLKYAKPDIFEKIKYSLHLPQYCSSLIHKKPVAEMTSIGCHTMLWDFQNNDYHPWVQAEGLTNLFPPIYPTGQTFNVGIQGKKLLSGVGIHDSSAALVPYLANIDYPFVLLSSGTWNITLNPFGEGTLTFDELKKDCLSFMNYQGNPVKSSRLFLGNEHNHQEKIIAAHFNKGKDYHKQVKFDPSLFQKLLKDNNQARKFFPQTMQVDGLLPDVPKREPDLNLFESYEEAYHQLNIDLVAMQALSMEVAIGNTAIDEIYVAGGFCENPLFMQLLADNFPEKRVFTTALSRASAYGAALVMHEEWNPEGEKDANMRFERCFAMEGKMAGYKLY